MTVKPFTYDQVAEMLVTSHGEVVIGKPMHLTYRTEARFLPEDDSGVNPIAINLYATVIIVMTPDRVVVNHGGWNTETTKRRINQFLRGYGYVVASQAGRWVAIDLQTKYTMEFQDGTAFTKKNLTVQDPTTGA